MKVNDNKSISAFIMLYCVGLYLYYYTMVYIKVYKRQIIKNYIYALKIFQYFNALAIETNTQITCTVIFPFILCPL